jgi:hypothetical protein
MVITVYNAVSLLLPLLISTGSWMVQFNVKSSLYLTSHSKSFMALEVTDIIYLILQCLHSCFHSASFLPSQLTTFVAEQSSEVKLLCLKHLNCVITIVRLIFIIMFSIPAFVTLFNMELCPYLNDSKDDENDMNVHTRVIRKRETEKENIHIKAIIMSALDISYVKFHFLKLQITEICNVLFLLNILNNCIKLCRLF